MDLFAADWLNANALRNYPITDGASRVDGTGAVLPLGLIVDLSFPVPMGTVEPQNFFIRTVKGFSSGVLITLGDVTSPGTDLASAVVFLSSHTRNASYAITGAVGTSVFGATGRITIGAMEDLAACATRTYDFSANPQATSVVVSAIRPLLRGVSKVVVRNADGTLAELTGAIMLESGANMALSVSGSTVVFNSDLQVLSTDVDDTCGCTADTEDDRGCIKTINGIAPNANGDFTISSVACIDITSIAGGLQLKDTCSQPCCGCDQLKELTAAAQAIRDEKEALLERLEQLRTRIDNLAHAQVNAALNPPSDTAPEDTQQTWWYLPIGPGGGGSVVPGPG